MTVPTLTGPVALKVPANSNSGTVLRLKGKGIPGRGTSAGGEPAGDLYVKLVVALPDKARSRPQEIRRRLEMRLRPAGEAEVN